MFEFQFPWLVLLIPLPYIFKKVIPPTQREKREDVPEIFFPLLDRLKASFSVSGIFQKTPRKFFDLVLFLSWVFLVLAMMQPEKLNQYQQVKNQGYDLMLAVDASGSMQAIDFSTSNKRISRLDATKEVVGKFAQNRQGDRVGLITFGEHAYLHVPLTLDTQSVSKMLNDTVTGMAGNSTAIGDAIGISVRVLRERPEGSRVLILLTDGEDNASSIPPLEAAKLAKQYGIRIYTIGMGKDGPVHFPNGFGGYSLVEVPIDEKLLKDIATMTGGQYYRATDQKALESIYSHIDQLEKTEANETLFLIRDPLYYYPLALSMLLLLGLVILQLLNRSQRRESL